MKNGKSLTYRNNIARVHEILDKTKHSIRKGPTAPVRRGLPSHAKTMTDMDTQKPLFIYVYMQYQNMYINSY